MATKTAQIVTWTAQVHCPHCGDPQPSPDNGSDVWMTEQIEAITGTIRNCSACDEPFRVILGKTARIES
jgi:hypothetical protein